MRNIATVERSRQNAPEKARKTRCRSAVITLTLSPLLLHPRVAPTRRPVRPPLAACCCAPGRLISRREQRGNGQGRDWRPSSHHCCVVVLPRRPPAENAAEFVEPEEEDTRRAYAPAEAATRNGRDTKGGEAEKAHTEHRQCWAVSLRAHLSDNLSSRMALHPPQHLHNSGANLRRTVLGSPSRCGVCQSSVC